MSHPASVWRKSSFSVDTGQCIELCDTGTEVLVRDSKHPDQGHVIFTRTEIATFIAGVKAGEFDDLKI